MNKYFILLVFMSLFGFDLNAQGRSSHLPNIVFILADDLGYGDLGCYGQKLIRTPNIDALAKSGIQFTDFYAGSTVCAPSRASLMTGQHTGKTYIRGNGELPLRSGDSIIPQYLKQKGYVNGMVGKWGLGLQNTEGVPEKKGWDYFVGHLHHIEGHYQRNDSIWKMIDGESRKVSVPKGSFLNETFTESATDFIQQNKDNPFFLYVSYTLPHAELIVQEKYLKSYQDKNSNSLFAPETEHPSGKHYGPQAQPKAAYAAMITAMDDYVGRILKQLKASGLEENTLVIFTSDNGTHTEGGRSKADAIDYFKSSGQFRGTKRDLYEGGIRIPFIAKWPGKITPNSTAKHIGAFWDVLPTFAQIAGLNLNPGDGISFSQVLVNKSQKQKHDYLYWEFYENGFKQAVRKDSWKAIRFYKDAKPHHTELYNLSEDAGEKKDLSQSMPDKVKELEMIMDKAHTESEHWKY